MKLHKAMIKNKKFQLCYSLRADEIFVCKVVWNCYSSQSSLAACVLTRSWDSHILSHDLCDNTQTIHLPGARSHFCSSIWFISCLSDCSAGRIPSCAALPFSFYVQIRISAQKDSCLRSKTGLQPSACSYLSTETRLKPRTVKVSS